MIDWKIDIGSMDLAGSFSFYIEYHPTTTDHPSKTPFKSFNVEPILKLNGEIIPTNALVIQTYLSKCIGPLDRWTTVLKGKKP